MGKILSKPKMPTLPSVPTIIDTPAATIPTIDNSTNSPPSGTGGDSSDSAPELTPDEVRVQNILTRKRGRVGTIATSFNGVLADSVSNLPARKTLLGE